MADNGVDSSSYVIAKYSYESQDSQELTIRKGERLMVLDDTKNWWLVRNAENCEGFVPSNYVKKVGGGATSSSSGGGSGSAAGMSWLKGAVEEKFNSMKEKIVPARKNSSPAGISENNRPSASALLAKQLSNPSLKSPSHSTKQSPMRLLAPNQNDLHSDQSSAPTRPSYATVRYDYEPTREDELKLTKGAQVFVLERSSDGWWRGRVGEQNGWFPSNYVEESSATLNNVTSSSAASPYKSRQLPLKPVDEGDADRATELSEESIYNISNGNDNGVKPASDASEPAVALHSFSAQSDEELSVRKNEGVFVIERFLDEPDWVRVRNQRGDCGLVPTSYVRVNGAPNGEASQTSQSQRQLISPPANAFTDPPANDQAKSPSYYRAIAQKRRDCEFANCPWYYGHLTRDESDQLLNRYGSDGHFIVRDSESNPGDFSISLKALGRNKHFWVRVNNEDSNVARNGSGGGDFRSPDRVHDSSQPKGYSIGNRPFDTFAMLIDHYTHHPIYTGDRGEKLYLVKPLPAA